MDNQSTDFKTLCAKGGERCDLHFLVENEVIQTKARVDKLEEKSANSYEVLNKTMNDMLVQMRTYMAQQEFRDAAQQDLKTMTLNNINDIVELKSSIKSVENQNKNVVDAIDKMAVSINTLSSDIKDMDKTVLGKDEVAEIVSNAIVADKNSSQNQWFESLPAKVSAGVAILSFIAFFTIKIVVMLLAI